MTNGNIEAFLDQKVPEHIDEFSTDSSVKLSPMNSDIDVLATGNLETMPNDVDKRVAFYNDVTPVSGAHPFVSDCAPLAVRFRCSERPLVGETCNADFLHDNKHYIILDTGLIIA